MPGPFDIFNPYYWYPSQIATVGAGWFMAPVPILYGKARLAGIPIYTYSWNRLFRRSTDDEVEADTPAEITNKNVGIVCLGFCEGPIASVGRVWWRPAAGNSKDKLVMFSSFSQFNTAAIAITGFSPQLMLGARPQGSSPIYTPSTLSFTVMATIPSSAPYQVKVRGYAPTPGPGNFGDVITANAGAEVYMIRQGNGTGGTPTGTGAFTVDANTGTFTFAAGDAGLTVRIIYPHNDTIPLNWPGTSYVFFPSGGLNTQSGSNISFEVYGMQGVGGDGRADPSAIITDLLTNTVYGCGLSSSLVEVTEYQKYVRAMGFLVNYYINSKASALNHIEKLLKVTNSAPVWTGHKLKIVPYGDTAITANGFTYTPPGWDGSGVQPQYAITQDDLIKTSEEDDLIQAERSNDQDVFNCWPVTYTDMRNSDTYPNLGSQASYSTLTIEDIETVGASNFGATKRAPETDGRLFDTPAAARALSKLLAQRSVYIRNTYKFKLGWRHILLEPMDIITVSETKYGLVSKPMRILSIEEADDGAHLEVKAEDWSLGVCHAPLQTIDQGDLDGSEGEYGGPGSDPGGGGGLEESPSIPMPWTYDFSKFNVDDWLVIDASTTSNLFQVVAGGLSGSGVLQVSGKWAIVSKKMVPYDPARIYALRCRMRETANPGSAVTFSAGLWGMAANKTTWVNKTAANNTTNHCVGPSAVTLSDTNWHDYCYYWLGTAGTGTDGGTDPSTPGQLHTNVRYVHVGFMFNIGTDTAAVQELDTASLEFAEAASAVDDVARAAATTATNTANQALTEAGQAADDAAAAAAAAQTAVDDAAAAQAAADAKVKTWYQASAPTTPGAGDIWFDTDDNYKMYRRNDANNAWLDVHDRTIDVRAQTYTGTVAQRGAKTGMVSGDLWVDTDSTKSTWRYSGSAWIRITTITTVGIRTARTGLTGMIVGDQFVETDYNNALWRYDTSWTQVSSPVKTSVGTATQRGAATGMNTGDLWITTDESNCVYRYSGSAWVRVTVKTTIGTRATRTGMTTGNIVGDTFIETDYSNLLWTWDGSAWQQTVAGNKTTAGNWASRPLTGNQIGDLYFVSDQSSAPYRWDGSTWVTVRDVGTVDAQTRLINQIPASLLTNGQVDAAALAAAVKGDGTNPVSWLAANAIGTNNLIANAVKAGKIDADVISSRELATDSVIAGKINAGAVRAREMAANSVTAKNLTITNWDNIWPNPTSEVSMPTGADGASAEWSGITNAGAGAYTGSYVRQVVSTGSLASIAYDDTAAGPTDQFYFEAQAKRTAGSSNGYIRIQALTAAKAPVGGGAGVDTWDSSTTTSSSWTKLSVRSGQLPAGTCFVRFSLIAAATSTTMQFDDLFARRMNDGNVIVDGSIMANHLQANSITTSKLIVTNWDNIWPNPGSEIDPPTGESYNSNLTLNIAYNGNPAFDNIVTIPDALNAGSAHSGTRVRRLDNRSGGTQITMGSYFPAAPGEEYWLSARMKVVASGGGYAGIYFNFLDRNKATVGGASFPIDDHQRNTVRAAGDAWDYVYISAIAPTGTVYAAPYFYANAAVAADFDSINLRKRGGAELIVDGAITARHVQTGSLIAQNAMVGSFENIFPNPTSEQGPLNGEVQDNAGNNPTLDGRYYTTTAYVGDYVRRFGTIGEFGPVYPCLVGEEYYIEAYARRVWSPAYSDWNSVTAYVVGNIIRYATNGLYYFCIANNTNQNPSTATTYWSPYYGFNTWLAATAYTTGQVVYRQTTGLHYVALQNSTGQDPATATAYWSRFTGYGGVKICFYDKLSALIGTAATASTELHTWTKVSVSAVAPSNAVKVGLKIYDTNASFYYEMDQILAKRKNSGQLIVDGTITSEKIVTDGLMTSDYTYTGISGLGTESALSGAKIQRALPTAYQNLPTWAPNTAYTSGQMVYAPNSDGSKTSIWLVNTSGTSVNTPASYNAWSGATAYVIGNIVKYTFTTASPVNLVGYQSRASRYGPVGDVLVRCKANHTNVNPTAANAGTYWELYGWQLGPGCGNNTFLGDPSTGPLLHGPGNGVNSTNNQVDDGTVLWNYVDTRAYSVLTDKRGLKIGKRAYEDLWPGRTWRVNGSFGQDIGSNTVWWHRKPQEYNDAGYMGAFASTFFNNLDGSNGGAFLGYNGLRIPLPFTNVQIPDMNVANIILTSVWSYGNSIWHRPTILGYGTSPGPYIDIGIYSQTLGNWINFGYPAQSTCNESYIIQFDVNIKDAAKFMYA